MTNTKVVFIAEPTIQEINEVLDCVALDHDLNFVLPVPDGKDRAELMQMGWCILWYDAGTLNPLGYTWFEFTKSHNYHLKPFFHICGTRFVQLSHFREIRRVMRRFFRERLKNRVQAYIPYENKTAQAFAEAEGFVPVQITERGILWDLAAAAR